MMEAKIFPILLFFTLLSTGLGWRDCSLQLDQNVPLSNFTSCNITSDSCSQITCSLLFSHEVIKLSLDIDQWQEPMTADVTVLVPELEHDWSATITDGEKIEVPGFPLEIEGFAVGQLDVYLQCSLRKENGTINFKVDLLATTEFEGTLFNSTLIAGRFPETQEPKIMICYIGWREFKKLSLTTKVVISTSVITFMILMLLTILFCCKRNRTATADQVKVKPPSYDEATSTKTKVPMHPLINEV